MASTTAPPNVILGRIEYHLNGVVMNVEHAFGNAERAAADDALGDALANLTTIRALVTSLREAL